MGVGVRSREGGGRDGQRKGRETKEGGGGRSDYKTEGVKEGGRGYPLGGQK